MPQFRRFAAETNPNIQMFLPMARVVGMLQEGVGHLMREAGLPLMMGVMEEGFRHVVGDRYAPNADRQGERPSGNSVVVILNGKCCCEKAGCKKGSCCVVGSRLSTETRTIPAVPSGRSMPIGELRPKARLSWK